MKSARACWLLTYLFFSATLAHAAPAVDPKEVTLKADTLTVDVPADRYRAQGSVQIRQQDLSLLADSVTYRRLTGDTIAEGGIFLEKGGDTLRGDRLSLNLVSQQGEVLNGELFIKKSNFRVRAERLQKTGAEDYRMERGTFTTCDGDNPSWRFEARKVVVTLDEFATARDAVFYVGDMPLLYTPYLIFPANTERQSGLLLPKLGHSTKKGFYLEQPYYWAINPSQDATFTLDIETSRGVGLGADYRYLRPHGSEGMLEAFGIYDSKARQFRAELDQKHLELLSPNLTLASNIHLISDRDYYKDFGEISGDYNRQLLESSASFSRRWERYGVSGEIRYTEDLEAPSNDATLQRLPALGFIAAGEKLGPLFFSMNSALINFQREEGLTGQRFDLHPRLTYYAKPARRLDLSLYGGYQQRMYSSKGGPAESGFQQRGQADAGGSLSLPLERVYQARLRHSLIPSLEYGFVQKRRDDDLPFFDYGDRVLGQSAVRWSLASVVTEKFAREGAPDEYRDLLYLKLSQGYQFSGERRNLGIPADQGSPREQVAPRDLLTLVDEGHRLTDLMLEGLLTPGRGVSLALDGRYNTVDGTLSTANVGLDVKGEGRNRAFVSYRHSRNQLDYLEGRFSFPISSQFSADLLGRYSLDRDDFLESRYALEYKRQCWSVILAYSDRVGSRDIPREKEFTINFSLAGLGALGPVRAF